MDDPEPILERLTHQLDRAAALRAATKQDPELAAGWRRLRAWQSVRLARTHAALLTSPRMGLAAAFFLTDLYGSEDLSKLDTDVRRVVPAKAAVFVDTGLPLEVTAFDKQNVRLRLDDHDFVAQRWPEVNNTTVSSRFAAALIRQLAQSRKFVFEFTPFSGAPVRAEFAVEGLSEYLSQLEQACLRN